MGIIVNKKSHYLTTTQNYKCLHKKEQLSLPTMQLITSRSSTLRWAHSTPVSWTRSKKVSLRISTSSNFLVVTCTSDNSAQKPNSRMATEFGSTRTVRPSMKASSRKASSAASEE